MTATNMCSNFGGFRLIPPIIFKKSGTYDFKSHRRQWIAYMMSAVLIGLRLVDSQYVA